VTWTKRKHSDLLRLLKEFAREHPDGTKEWQERLRNVQVGIAAERPGRKDDFISLGWWCEIVNYGFGLPPHPALKWLVKKYEDADIELFHKRWGSGTADSVARRLYGRINEKLDNAEFPPPNREQCAALKALHIVLDEKRHLRWHEMTLEQALSGAEPSQIPQQEKELYGLTPQQEKLLYRLTFEILPRLEGFEGCFPKPRSHVANGTQKTKSQSK
jgi:hypothetical protein